MIADTFADSLPVAGIASRLNKLLEGNSFVVVTAPPGAGKSTLLPLTILEGKSGKGKVLMLEPRRLAARQIAVRMASMLGEKTGETVGYRVRFESRVSTRTKVEVLTEGILTRMLLEDPALEGVDVVIFDEFHERSLNADLALALVRESCRILRPDLKVVIMSATMDSSEICSGLGGACLLESSGRCFPVETILLGDPPEDSDIALEMARAIKKAHSVYEGDILAFFPGEGEIRRCAEILGGSLGGTDIRPLYGMLPFEEQKLSIMPSPPGRRKVVLATSIAETSLTIEGVRIVVDCGLCRRQVFNPRSSLSRLETMRISLDMARQREGRAGRTAPGVCLKLWSAATQARMAETRTPEILECDLAPAALSVASWGERDMGAIPWLTPPPHPAAAKATELLKLLGAVEEDGRISALGSRMSSMPCHPRIARMILLAETEAQKSEAAAIAALLEDRDPMPDAGVSIGERLKAVGRREGRGWAGINRAFMQYLAIAGLDGKASREAGADPFMSGALIAAAYPERIARLREEGCGRFLLSSGKQARMEASDALSASGWIAVASMDEGGPEQGRIFLAAPLDPGDIRQLWKERDRICWDERAGAVSARHECSIGCLTISSQPIRELSPKAVEDVICDAVSRNGERLLDFSGKAARLQARVACVRAWHPELELPDISTPGMLERCTKWLPLYLGKATTAQELRKLDMEAVMLSELGFEQQKALDRIAPSHVEVPTGSRISIQYRSPDLPPLLSVRLQECFGMVDTPKVDCGKVGVLMDLLSPGFKSVQITSDLRSFWKSAYFEVRGELRRRYPRHSWPDNPLEAQAVRGVRKKA